MNVLKFLARGLFSNAVIVKESKKQKFYIAILIFLLTVVISIIPIFTSIANNSGGNILTQTEALQFDYSLQRFSHEYLTNNADAKLEMEIVDGKLVFKEGKTFQDLENKKEIVLLNKSTFPYLEIHRSLQDKDQITLLVCYVSSETSDTGIYKNLNEKVTDVFNRLAVNYPIKNDDGTDSNISKTYSVLLFSEKDFAVRLYDNNAQTEFTKENETVALKKSASVASSASGIYASVSDVNRNLNLFDNENPTQILAKWKEFFTESYKDLKNQILFLNVGMFSGINALLLLFLALLIFILSRFKSSICGKQKYSDCLKYISFASLCPSLLALLIGFMLPGFQSIGFLTFAGLRAIFLSTRLTRGDVPPAPETKDNNKKIVNANKK